MFYMFGKRPGLNTILSYLQLGFFALMNIIKQAHLALGKLGHTAGLLPYSQEDLVPYPDVILLDLRLCTFRHVIIDMYR